MPDEKCKSNQIFGDNAIFSPTLFSSLIEAFPHCRYEFKQNESSALTGINSVVNEIMNTQATFKKEDSFKFGSHNWFFLNRFLPRISLHLVLNTVAIPNTLITTYVV